MSHRKAKKLVEQLLEAKPSVPVDDIVSWAPCLFDGYNFAGFPEPPEEFFDAFDSTATPEELDAGLVQRYSDWLNAHWKEICDVDADDGPAPDSWRGMVWTPELARRALVLA